MTLPLVHLSLAPTLVHVLSQVDKFLKIKHSFEIDCEEDRLGFGEHDGLSSNIQRTPFKKLNWGVFPPLLLRGAKSDPRML